MSRAKVGSEAIALRDEHDAGEHDDAAEQLAGAGISPSHTKAMKTATGGTR